METRHKEYNFHLLNDGSDEEAPPEDRIYTLDRSSVDSDRSLEERDSESAIDKEQTSTQETIPDDSQRHQTVQSSSQSTLGFTTRPSKKARHAPATEWIWDHFSTVEVNRSWENRSGKTVHKDHDIYCSRCKYSTSDSKRKGNTSNMKLHLEKQHGIFAPSSSNDSKPGIMAVSKEPNIATMIKGTSKLSDQEVLRRNIMRWVVCDKNAFNAVESPYFQQIWIDSPFYDIPFNSRHTIRKEIMLTFEEQRAQLKEELATSCQTIALSLDEWSSTNHVSFLGVVGHWLDENCEFGFALSEMLSY